MFSVKTPDTVSIGSKRDFRQSAGRRNYEKPNIDGAISAGRSVNHSMAGYATLPQPSIRTRLPICGLDSLSMLDIINDDLKAFKGRSLGVLLTDGADHRIFQALVRLARSEGANVEVIAPTAGSVRTDRQLDVEVSLSIDGESSAHFDAVVLMPSLTGVTVLVGKPKVQDFMLEAFSHCKFIAYTESALPLLQDANLDKQIDDGFCKLTSKDDADTFIQLCRELRYWPRETKFNN